MKVREKRNSQVDDRKQPEKGRNEWIERRGGGWERERVRKGNSVRKEMKKKQKKK